MRRVWCIADSIISPLGSTTEENYLRLRVGESAISEFSFNDFKESFFWLGKINDNNSDESIPFFDVICRKAAEGALKNLQLPVEKTLLVLSTTKGNISLLDKGIDHPQLGLYQSAKDLAGHLGITNYQVVSNACISGVLAMVTAKRFINSGKYDHAIIVGADVISEFIVSGFQSLLALSNAPCRPFDKDRSGINLGEAAAAIVLSAAPESTGAQRRILLSGEGLSNDANHISGPSRTGEELALAIHNAVETARIKPADIDFISAHGTATLYNDEMETKAFNLSGLQQTPLNSLKGYFGHTLGAAGVLESVLSIQGMLRNEIIGTKGFDSPGVSLPLNVIRDTLQKSQNKILKTASGFGGCNAAVIFEKLD